jgi:hypothetical protein
VAFEEELVGVAALLSVHGVEAEVVNQEQIDRHELAELGLVALGQTGVLEGWDACSITVNTWSMKL